MGTSVRDDEARDLWQGVGSWPMKFDKDLDVRGLACPLPVVKAKKALVGMSPGQVLKVVATDSGSVSDMEAFAEAAGHELLASEVSGKDFVFFLKR